MILPTTYKLLQPLIALVLFLGACRPSGPGSSTISLPQTTPSVPPAPPPTSVLEDPGDGTAMIISGSVKDVSLSARVIRLQKPVDGIDLIALDTELKLLDAEKNAIELQDIHIGDTLTAWGRAGDSNVLIANRLELIVPSNLLAENELIRDCRDQGGRWEQLGILGYGCNLPAADAGKPCSGWGDCEGLCMALNDHDPEQSVGACSAWQSNFGCNLIIDDGEVHEICID